MSKVSLKEAEQSLYTLWTRRGPREEFLDGSVPEGVNSEFVDELDLKGVNLYSSLIRTGQNDLMHSIYPGCAGLIGKGFEDMVGKYFEHFPVEHHNFNRAAQRFSRYLAECGDKDRYVKRYPFLPELADYEWVELEILEHPSQPIQGDSVSLDSPEVFDQFCPMVNNALVVRSYKYPIAKIVDWLKDGVKLPRRVKKDPVDLAVYRSCKDHSARFLELGEIASLVINQAKEKPTSYAELIKISVEAQPECDPQAVVVDFLALIEKLVELELFVGSKRI